MLQSEQRQIAIQYNLRARQLFWRGIIPETHSVWHLNGDALVDWAVEFQNFHGLLADGCMGPSTIIAVAALARGGIGGPIIDGEEVGTANLKVARLFMPGEGAAASPDLCCILSMPEIAKTTRERLAGHAKVRAHFAIDSSRGQNGASLVVQWADPMRAVPFCPAAETDDYPKNRQCVGIELENFLLLCQIDADARQWRRRRPVAKAVIGGKTVSQPILYDSQIRSLDLLLQTLEDKLRISKTFPMKNGVYRTDILEGQDLDAQKGVVARFNYIDVNHEPGAGFVNSLETIFGKVQPQENSEHQSGNPSGMDHKPENAGTTAKPRTMDTADFSDAQRELAEHPEPTSSYRVRHEELPRFNLSQAVANAYATGKAGRADRLAEKCKKFDDN